VRSSHQAVSHIGPQNRVGPPLSFNTLSEASTGEEDINAELVVVVGRARSGQSGEVSDITNTLYHKRIYFREVLVEK
jgi:hypothetical protein